MSDSVERLLVRIDATSEQLRRELKAADMAVGKADNSIGKRLQRMQKSFTDTAARAAKLGAAATAAGAAITAKLVSSGLQSVDSLAKVSGRLGVTTEALAELRFAAEQTGVSTSTLDMALQRMTRRVAEAAQGTGEAKAAIAELGLSAQELNDLSPDQTFRRITDAMEGVGNQSDKVRLAMKLFDSEGVSLVQTMAQGTEGLDAFAEQARQAGLTLSQFDAAKVEAANDAMNRVRSQVTGLSQQMAVKFAPVLEGIADRLFGVGAEAGGMGNIATKVFDAIVKAAGFVGNAIRGIQVGWHGMKLAFQEAARFIYGGLDKLAQRAIEMYNMLPWVDEVEVKSMFSGFLATMDAEIAQSRNKIDELLMAPLPSDSIKQFTDTASRQFQATAIEVGTVTEATETLQATTTEAAKTLADDWDRALQGTFERIDQSFANAWKGAFDSFSDFASGIKDALKNLLGELAHMAITKPILLNIGAALGIGGASSSAMASTGIGSVFSGGGISGALSGFGNMGAGLYNSIGQGASFLADLGVPGMDALSTASFGKGMTATGMGSFLSAGAGIGGALLGNAAFGQTSGIGSTIGGIGGSIFGGPIGAAIGSFLGSGIESLFGGDSPSQATGTALLDLSSGSVNLGTASGSAASPELRENANTLVQQFASFAEMLGGSSGLIDVGASSRSGLHINGVKYGENIDGLMRDGFERVIQGAHNLTDTLRSLLLGFRGTNDELVAFSESMLSISRATSDNVVARIRDSWESLAGQTAIDVYQRQIHAIKRMTENFDGSVASAQTLNAALAQNQQAAAALASQIMQLSDQIGSMFSSSAQAIRESVMSEEELFQARRAERNALAQSIGTLSDPEELSRVASRINQLNNQLFNSLDDPTQKQAERFAQFAEQTDALVQQRLDRILDNIEVTQERQNQRIQNMMEDAAAAQQAAANTFLQGAREFGSAVAGFQAIEVNA